jgi:hypothetical protein
MKINEIRYVVAFLGHQQTFATAQEAQACAFDLRERLAEADCIRHMNVTGISTVVPNVEIHVQASLLTVEE